MNPTTESFIDQFNQLEQIFKSRLGKSGFTPFTQMVQELSRKDAFVRGNRMALEDLADLRNVIVHKEGSPIHAIPSDESLYFMKRFIDRYEKPKNMMDMVTHKVQYIRPDQSALSALQRMQEHHLTKLPVYENNHFKGLLSGNVITRWLSMQIDHEGQMCLDLDKTTVADILRSGEKSMQVSFIPRHMDVFHFIDVIKEKPSKAGVYIITENGRPTEKPLRIVTYYDTSRFLKEMDL